MRRSWLLSGVTALALVTLLLSLGWAKPQRAKTIIPGKKGTVLIFVASLCPCTDAHRIMIDNLVEETSPKGFNFYSVFSNIGETEERAEYFFRNIGWKMPYYLDSDGKLAEKYKASRTPQTVVLNPRGDVLFNGPIDDANVNQGRVENPFLKNTLVDILANKAVRNPLVPPLGGCWIVRDTTSIARPPELSK
ncbi:MAG: hypothetical protein A2142_03120 [candidate division Zixibacteria bacterium RBG_16_48_11]|nr:MAG: hypothetical protein A2142_03120 [candidate division Zixibacteria bacterium RBG_16_48_11]